MAARLSHRDASTAWRPSFRGHERQNSNWSNGLTVWDRLHGTFGAASPDGDFVIGVPRYRKPLQVTVGKLMSCRALLPPRPAASPTRQKE